MPVCRDFCEDGDARAGNAAGSGGRDSASEVLDDAVLGGELPLGRRLVELRLIELVQPVLCEGQQLLGGGIGGDQICEILVLGLALLGRLCDSLIQSLDIRGQRGCLVLEGCDALRGFLDGSFGVRERALQDLLLVVRRVELGRTIDLLLVII
mmetsp:Transcript_90919/g.283262  ORF Transcript_90919/g.283262 Transcript_90919/m.283262 type:complete len:153 (-) Transcript_90919:162-620(-)